MNDGNILMNRQRLTGRYLGITRTLIIMQAVGLKFTGRIVVYDVKTTNYGLQKKR
jgi:hypothetical protein